MVLYPFIVLFLLYMLIDIKQYQRTTTINNAASSFYVDAIRIPLPTCNITSNSTDDSDCDEFYDPMEPHVPCSQV
jgi:hypothetical protein